MDIYFRIERDFALISILKANLSSIDDLFRYGEPTEDGYFTKIAGAFVNLRRDFPSKGNYTPEILFDGANGVGALSMAKLIPRLKDSLKVQIFNAGEGELNHLCGADYVKASLNIY